MIPLFNIGQILIISCEIMLIVCTYIESIKLLLLLKKYNSDSIIIMLLYLGFQVSLLVDYIRYDY